VSSSYSETLLQYCQTHSEESLYEASLLSSGYIQEGMGPDDIVSIHFDAVREIAGDESFSPSDRIRVLNDAHQFLLEVMIGYGAQYKQFLDLRLAEAMRRAESAERSEREKMEVLGMIAHELGNPLTVALGNMQIAAGYLDSADLEMIRMLVADSKDALDSLAHLTSQIVAASRGDDPTLEIEPVDMQEPLKKTRQWAAKAADEKRIQLAIPDLSAPIIVSADEASLASIINNLVSNAIRYTPSGGSVSVSLDYDEDMAKLKVTDSGIGMTEEEQKHIFEKFYRGPAAKKMVSQGLGMGLNIASRLARAQSGSLTVSSAPNAGSTFTLALPICKDEMQLRR